MTLAADPVHPSTYYLAIDGRNNESLLLHIATASAPTSGVFPGALLIGRMHGIDIREENGQEFLYLCCMFPVNLVVKTDLKGWNSDEVTRGQRATIYFLKGGYSQVALTGK